MIINALYGGQRLRIIFAVFWFITVLWCSQNLFNYLIQSRMRKWVFVAFVFIGYLCSYIPCQLPWDIQIVPMATVYLWIGFLLKRITNNFFQSTPSMWLRTSYMIVSLLVLMFIYIVRDEFIMDMKFANYGIPGISLAASIFASISVAVIAIEISRLPLIAKVFAFLGEASMVIMYLHLPICVLVLQRFGLAKNIVTAVLLSTVLSIVTYLLLKQNRITRVLFLGSELD